ncbi:MAG: hypothetical protein LBD53_07725, partial [Tannerella sp.]|nr:hypothetical protein [Tannerella sp.]
MLDPVFVTLTDVFVWLDREKGPETLHVTEPLGIKLFIEKVEGLVHTVDGPVIGFSVNDAEFA